MFVGKAGNLMRKLYFEYTLAILLFVLMLPIPKTLFPDFLLLRPIIFSLGTLGLFFLHLKSGREKGYRTNIYEVVFLAFLLFQLLSALWASNSSLVYSKLALWTSLFLFYICCKQFGGFNLKAKFTKSAFYLLLILCGILTFCSFEIGPNNLPSYSYDGINSIGKHFGFNGNYLSSLILILLPIGVLHLNGRTTFVRLLIIISIIYLIVLCNARGTTLALLSVIGYSILFRTVIFKQILKPVIIAVILMLIGIYAVVPNIVEFLSMYNPMKSIYRIGNSERLDIWETAFKIFREDYLLGVGNGNWFIEFPKYGLDQFGYSFNSHQIYNHAHNLIIETTAELGIFGFIFISILLFFPVFYQHTDRLLKWLISSIGIVYILTSSFYGIAYPHAYHLPSQVIIFFLVISAIDFKSFNFVIPKQFWKTGFLLMSMVTLGYHFIHLKGVYDIKTANNFNNEKRFDLQEEYLKKAYNENYFQFNSIANLNRAIGLCQWRQKKRDSAIESMNIALEQNPYDVVAWMHLGNMYKGIGDLNNAEIAYKNSIAINPTYYNSVLGLADVNLRNHDFNSFDSLMQFYFNDVKVKLEKHYQADYLDSENPAYISFINKMCHLEDKALHLFERKNKIQKKTKTSH